METPDIWITGLGVVSAAGENTEQTLRTFNGSQSPPQPRPFEDSSLECPVFHAPLTPTGQRRSRTADLAFHALDEALESAGHPERDSRARLGICVGTTVACQLNDLEFYRDYRETSCPSLDPVCRFLKSNLAEALADSIGAGGPRSTIVNACSSGADAIGMAASWLASDLCDVVIAGGADELNRVPLCGFHSLGIVSDAPCRPFDRDRDGLNLGEGAGLVVLESEASARRRKRPKELLLSGFGAACDAHHITAPHPEGIGLNLALERAVEVAGLNPDDLAFVNAHGTATPDNDRVEGCALADAFGEDVPVLSTKGYTGHTLGAAGGIEAVFAALGLRDGRIPPSAGFSNPDPDIPVRPVQDRLSVDGTSAVSTSLAFGGNNSAIVIRRDA